MIVTSYRPMRVSVFPMGSALPKYFAASSRVTTAEFGPDSAVEASPSASGNVNIVKTDGVVHMRRSSNVFPCALTGNSFPKKRTTPFSPG